jgi:hypothetical protein
MYYRRIVDFMLCLKNGEIENGGVVWTPRLARDIMYHQVKKKQKNFDARSQGPNADHGTLSIRGGSRPSRLPVPL